MKYVLKCICSFLLLAVISVSLSAAEKSITSLKDKKIVPEHVKIAAVTIRSIEHEHYLHKKFDDARQDMMLRSLLKSLDPGKMYLTQQEVDEFRAYVKANPKKILQGDLTLPFAAFNLVQLRYSQYAAEARKILSADTSNLMNQKGLTIEVDRKDSPWAADEKELSSLWKRKLINELIVLRLADRATEKNKAEGKKDEDDDDAFFQKKTPEERLLKRIDLAMAYYKNVKSIDVLEIYLNAVSASYDPHTAYLSPRSDEDFTIDMSLKLIGIGATLTSVDGYTKIVSLVPGGPADKDGRLQPGDRIIAVAQENKPPVDIVDMPLSDVVRLIRGKVNTKVTLSVLTAKNGFNSVPVKITITRAEVIVKDSEAKGEIRTIKNAKGEDRKIGILTLPSFYMDFDAARSGDRNYKCASRDVRKILLDFKKQNVDGVVMDLRTNSGGSLPDVAVMCGFFVKDGPTVQVRCGNDVETLDDPDGGEIVYDGPMVVAVSRLSASAAEIFAAAMQDYGRAVIVGDEKTHGKGSVQICESLDRMMIFLLGKKYNSGAVKITNAKFYRVNGESTQLKGVIPDVILPSYFDGMDIGEDKLDNPLPWDRIAPSHYSVFPDYTVIQGSMPILRERSNARISSNSEFQGMIGDIERFKKIRERKLLKLNLEERWNEYMEEKKFSDEQEKLFNRDRKMSKDGKKQKEEKDLYLDESVNILVDYIDLSRSLRSK